MKPDCVVVDANIAFKALVSQRGDLRERFHVAPKIKFHAPGYLFIELFKHKTKLMAATKLAEEELLEALQVLVSRMTFINEADIPLNLWMEAHRLCRGVDEHDMPYIALTLHLDGCLWTEDSQLKEALRAKGFDRFYPL